MIGTPQDLRQQERVRIGIWLATLAITFVIALLLPLDTIAGQLWFAGAFTCLGLANIAFGRAYPMAPCEVCRNELHRVVVAARRAGLAEAQCPKCGWRGRV